MILISVIVPVYKVEQYLKDCLDSLINQTYKNLEIILVDDGSPDSCPAICDSYADQDNRVHVIHKQNGGLSDARNTGIKDATGDYLLFVDSDDKLADCNVIKNLVEFLNKTEAVITYCAGVTRFTDKQAWNETRVVNKKSQSLTPDELADFVKKNNCYFSAWVFVVKRVFILEHLLFFRKGFIHEDTEWIPRLLLVQNNSKVFVFTKPFYVYRNNPQSITHFYGEHRLECLFTILAELSAKISEASDKQFLIKWFNRNLYYLFVSLENDCMSSSDLFTKNISNVKQLFQTNHAILNFRNRILYIIMSLNPKFFFQLRRFINRLRGL